MKHLHHFSVKLAVIVAFLWIAAWSISHVADISFQTDIESLMRTFAPALAMTVLGVVFLIGCAKEKDPLLSEKSADFIYFLGYLGTVWALCALIYFVGQTKQGVANTPMITAGISVALSTTIVGLIFMTLIRSHHAGVGEEITRGALDRIGTQIDGSRKGLTAFTNRCTSAADAIGKVEVKTKVLSGDLDRIKQALPDLATGLENANNLLAVLGSIEIKKETIDALSRDLDAMTRLAKKCREAEKNVGTLSDSAKNTTSSMSKFAKGTKESTESVNDVKIAISELHRVIETDFVALLERIGKWDNNRR